MKYPYIIKCNVGHMKYLYWNGVAWTVGIERAKEYDTKQEAEKEIKDLSIPRTASKGARPEALTFNPREALV